MNACQGGYVCENRGGHSGSLRRYTVSGGGFSDKPMDFTYCDVAAEEDRQRGFTVTEKDRA